MALLRQDKMTKDERIIALLKRQPLDRIPVYALMAGFAALNVGYTIEDQYSITTGQKSRDAFTWTAEQYGFQDLPVKGHGHIGSWEFGGEIAAPTSEFAQAAIVTRYPVVTEDSALKLELPDVRRAGVIPIAMENSKDLERSGAAIILFQLPGPWDVASSMCGLDQMCRWAMKKPELSHRLLRLATDFLVQVAQYWIDTFGPERVLPLGGHPQTSNDIVSPKIFEAFCLPYIKELHEKVLAIGIKHILCHICGEQNLNLPYWEQIPFGDPGIVSFGHEVDLETAGKYFPNDIIAGNVEPAIIQTGTPEQVYELTKTCIKKGRKHPGGFMLAPGCEMPPKAPSYNVWTMMKAISDLGWYE
ncbi:uroporphyrinogen decarboxylase family protein [Chloroflexota bacterium]